MSIAHIVHLYVLKLRSVFHICLHLVRNPFRQVQLRIRVFHLQGRNSSIWSYCYIPPHLYWLFVISVIEKATFRKQPLTQMNKEVMRSKSNEKDNIWDNRLGKYILLQGFKQGLIVHLFPWFSLRTNVYLEYKIQITYSIMMHM